MLIDFHTHFFPDRIAKDTVDHLSLTGGIPYSGDGTLQGLLSFMEKDGVALSVNQPVATKQTQVISINRKMIELNSKLSNVISFGSMHPDFDGFEDELAYLKNQGIKGIKLHPEYQSFCPEEKRLFGLYESCAAHGLILLFHAGIDLAYPGVRCTPEGIKELLDIQGLTLVLAHMGGYRLWDEVEKHLIGRNVYFDLAYCSEMDDRQLKRMILNHGPDRILFATDFPWERASAIRQKVEALGLDEKDRENIYFRNAARLLQLPQ